MEFQLPSVLQKKLTPYDEVRRKVETAKKKAIRKASRPFHLGLPPVDLLIPNDVLPKNCDKEGLIKRITLNELNNRYTELSYPQHKDTNKRYDIKMVSHLPSRRQTDWFISLTASEYREE